MSTSVSASDLGHCFLPSAATFLVLACRAVSRKVILLYISAYVFASVCYLTCVGMTPGETLVKVKAMALMDTPLQTPQEKLT